MIKQLFQGLSVLTALSISSPAFAEATSQLPTSSLPVPTVAYEVVQPVPRPPTFEEDAHELAMTLYMEGRTNEPEEGLRAIASVIMNRVRSPFFPDTIREVVSQGANGQTTGSCQFSFRCDEHPEDIELLCRLRPLDLQKHWGENACQKRWDAYLAFAKDYLKNGQDNTGKALMYYAAWMKKPPYWHIDLEKDSRVQRGSHLFFRSKRFVEKAPVAETGPAVSPTQSAQMR